MQPFAYLIKVSLPNYLAGLPIPDSFGGWFRLGCKYFIFYYLPFSFMYHNKIIICCLNVSVRDIIALIPPTAAVAGFTYVTYRAFCPHGRPPAVVNPKILKTSAKVVDTIDVEDISEKAVFCRCWRSKNVS